MDYSEELADRVRHSLTAQGDVTEGSLLGGKSFWVDDRLVISVHGDDLLIRVPVDDYPEVLESSDIRPYEFAARPVPGWVVIDAEAIADDDALAEWLNVGLRKPAAST